MRKVRIQRAVTWAVLLTAAACAESTVSPNTAPELSVREGRSTSSSTTGKIVFRSDRDNLVEELYSMNSDGTGVTRLTFNQEYDWTPSWSPNGKQIHFAQTVGGGAFDIFVMNANGTGLTNLTRSPAVEDEDPMSNGKRIVFSSGAGDDDIYTMNLDGTGVTQLTTAALSNNEPRWSPDGKRIVFSSNRDLNREIYVMNADGTGVTNLTNSLATDLGPDWSPDGKQIVFSSDRNGDFQLFRMNADGTAVTQVTFLPAGRAFRPRWGPSGKQFLFQYESNSQWDLFKINIDGTQLTQLTFTASNEETADWQ